MRPYNCDVNVGGDVLTTVEKVGISAAEVMVLRAIHGHDNVKNLRKGHMDKRSHAEERAHLTLIYGGSRVKIDGDTKRPVLPLLFGAEMAGGKLPVELENDADIPFAAGVDDEPAEPAKGKKAA